MNPILLAVLAVGAIGLLCAVMLAVAAKVIAVCEDEKFEKLRACLPGANCGACGYAGCDGYAHALAEGKAKTNLCVPGADDAAAKLADVLGVAAEDVVEKTAYVACRGSGECTGARAAYEGVASCAAAKLVYGGPGKCVWGCLGFGDCAAVCPQGAISVADGLAHVEPKRCVGCGLCAKACPNGVIHIVPDVSKTAVLCSSRAPGAAARKQCAAACIGCKKCEKVCPVGAVKVENNLAAIDYALCTSCGACAAECPTGAIRTVDLRGAHA